MLNLPMIEINTKNIHVILEYFFLKYFKFINHHI